MRKSIGAAAGLSFSLILGACSGDAAVSGLDANTTMDAAGRTVVISAKALALLVGQSQQLTATGSGNASLSWRANDTTIAVVSKDGVVTARGAGSTKIVVSARGASDEATVTVTSPVTVASIVFSPSTANLAVGESARPVVTVLDANGASITGRTGTYASSAPSIASVDATGLVTALAQGTANVTYTVDGKSGAMSVNVQGSSSTTTQPAPVATVGVTLASSSLTVGGSTQASAVARDASGNVLTGRAVTWSSSNPAVATVTTSGVVTAVASGTASIVAVVEGKTGSAALSVSAPIVASVATVGVSLAASNVTIGGTTQASAVARDASGNVLTGRVVTWSSSNAAVATVSSSGLVTAVTAGSASIVATVEGKAGSAAFSATVPVTVAPAPAPSGSGILASADFEGGTLSPFSNPWGTDIDVVADPTGSGRGKVARIHYAGANQDRNRAMAYERPTRYGQSLFFKGEFYVASTAGMNDGNYQRKLLYWQPKKDYNKYGSTGGPTFWSVVLLFGNGLHYTGGYVQQGGGNVETMTGNLATVQGNTWNTVEQEIVMNSSPSAQDGIVRVWLNGRLVFEKTNMRWTDPNWVGQMYGPTPLDANDLYFNGYLVGDQVNYAFGSFDEYRYWDNVAFSTSRVP